MTNQPGPPQPTEEYRGNSPSGRFPERVRVALVVGPGPTEGQDLYVLLLRRLRVFTSILAVGLVVLFALALPVLWSDLRGEILKEAHIAVAAWRDFVFRGVFALASVVAAVLLWRRPPSTLRGLRALELIVVGLYAALNLLIGYFMYEIHLEWYASESMPFRFTLAGLYTVINALYWFCLLVMYGTLIPNTWRRCAAVVGILALSPLALFAVMGFWLRPVPPEFVYSHLIGLAFWNGVAVAIAVFSSSRIEILRRQAAEARKLGQYVLKERLGAGGMGEVYRAEHLLLRRPCALKVIRPERAGDPKNLRRFEREVQVTATLTHPNTVQIYDYGHAEDGTFYYVMEYLPGLTLEELVAREGPLPAARVIHFLRQVCGALKEAHCRGLIHRDIKPGNVMVCERGGVHDVAKLLDFGLVLPPANDPEGAKLTQDGGITGTPAYLSPEQAGGQESLDARSDIYSVGALAYFLLMGQSPFAGRSAARMIAAHIYETPEPLSGRRPDVPADLEAVVLRCLAKESNARFSDAESLDLALAACRTAG